MAHPTFRSSKGFYLSFSKGPYTDTRANRELVLFPVKDILCS